eukprot:4366517-Karenia_brevis.AAC.1
MTVFCDTLGSEAKWGPDEQLQMALDHGRMLMHMDSTSKPSRTIRKISSNFWVSPWIAIESTIRRQK